MEIQKKFYQKTWFIILMLLLFPPLGIILMWSQGAFSKKLRVIVTVILCGIYVLGAMGGGAKNDTPQTSEKKSNQKKEVIDPELAKRIKSIKESPYTVVQRMPSTKRYTLTLKDYYDTALKYCDGLVWGKGVKDEIDLTIKGVTVHGKKVDLGINFKAKNNLPNNVEYDIREIFIDGLRLKSYTKPGNVDINLDCPRIVNEDIEKLFLDIKTNGTKKALEISNRSIDLPKSGEFCEDVTRKMILSRQTFPPKDILGISDEIKKNGKFTLTSEIVDHDKIRVNVTSNILVQDANENERLFKEASKELQKAAYEKFPELKTIAYDEKVGMLQLRKIGNYIADTWYYINVSDDRFLTGYDTTMLRLKLLNDRRQYICKMAKERNITVEEAIASAKLGKTIKEFDAMVCKIITDEMKKIYPNPKFVSEKSFSILFDTNGELFIGIDDNNKPFQLESAIENQIRQMHYPEGINWFSFWAMRLGHNDELPISYTSTIGIKNIL